MAIKQAGKEIRIKLALFGDLNALEVLDQGDGFDYNSLTDPTSEKNILKHTGRGLFIIRKYSESVRWLGNGNHMQIFVKQGMWIFIKTRVAGNITN